MQEQPLNIRRMTKEELFAALANYGADPMGLDEAEAARMVEAIAVAVAKERQRIEATVPIEAIVVLGTRMGSNNTRACLLALSQLSQYVAENGLQDMDLSTYVERRMALEPQEENEQ